MGYCLHWRGGRDRKGTERKRQEWPEEGGEVVRKVVERGREGRIRRRERNAQGGAESKQEVRPDPECLELKW